MYDGGFSSRGGVGGWGRWKVERDGERKWLLSRDHF